jgi:glucokinase
MEATARELRGGIDLGGTKIEAIVVDSGNTVLGSSRHPTPASGGPSAVAAEMVAAIKAACQAAGVESSQLLGVGVGSPGVVDDATGAVSSARNLPDWDGSFELGDTLSRAIGTPVFVGNDVQVATDAEFALGAGRPYDSLLGVMWGTGVGGGIILNREPWLGRGGAGEIGHMVIKINGRRCPCGRRGCMEAYSGRAAMEARARKQDPKGKNTELFKIMKERGRPKLTSSVWARALERKDKLATELIDEAVEALGAGIASAQNLLDVEAIIIGGGLGVRFGEPLVERIRTAMGPHLFNDTHPPDVLLAGLGDLGGGLGAALLVSRRGQNGGGSGAAAEPPDGSVADDVASVARVAPAVGSGAPPGPGSEASGASSDRSGAGSDGSGAGPDAPMAGSEAPIAGSEAPIAGSEAPDSRPETPAPDPESPAT